MNALRNLFGRIKTKLASRHKQADSQGIGAIDIEKWLKEEAEIRRQNPDSFGAMVMNSAAAGFKDVITTAEEAAQQEQLWAEIQRQRKTDQVQTS